MDAKTVINEFYIGWKNNILDYYMEIAEIWKEDFTKIAALGLGAKEKELASKAMHNPEDLEKILERDFEKREENLYKKIDKKGLDIENLTILDLKMGNDGSINGRLTDGNKTVTIETISAGGYNIQKYHYRVLVK